MIYHLSMIIHQICKKKKKKEQPVVSIFDRNNTHSSLSEHQKGMAIVVYKVIPILVWGEDLQQSIGCVVTLNDDGLAGHRA